MTPPKKNLRRIGSHNRPRRADQVAPESRTGVFYGPEYQRARAALLASSPPCHWQPCTRPATEADHYPPVKYAGAHLNLVPSCRFHNAGNEAERAYLAAQGLKKGLVPIDHNATTPNVSPVAPSDPSGRTITTAPPGPIMSGDTFCYARWWAKTIWAKYGIEQPHTIGTLAEAQAAMASVGVRLVESTPADIQRLWAPSN